jgi:hypothetical protein
MKYSPGQGWTVHAYGPNGPDGFWIVTGSSRKIAMPPGTVGYDASNGAFASFDDCVSANRALSPLELDLPTGSIGIWLEDSPYTDNVAGSSGRNPTWRLDCL